MRNLSIYFKGFEKVFDRFEEVKQSIMAGIHPLGDLTHSFEKDIAHRNSGRTHTSSRMARPVCIAFAGGDDCILLSASQTE
jgi:hypothetical protein